LKVSLPYKSLLYSITSVSKKNELKVKPIKNRPKGEAQICIKKEWIESASQLIQLFKHRVFGIKKEWIESPSTHPLHYLFCSSVSKKNELKVTIRLRATHIT